MINNKIVKLTILLSCVALLFGQETDIKYLKLLQDGDESYYSNNFLSSYNLYQEAQKERPTESAPMLGLYHSSIALFWPDSALKYAQKLYLSEKNVANLQRLIYANGFMGRDNGGLKLFAENRDEEKANFDWLGQGLYQGGYLLEAFRISRSAVKKYPEPFFQSRQEALKEEYQIFHPRLSVANNTILFNYQNHNLFKDGWYNGVDLNLDQMDYQLNFHTSTTNITPKNKRVTILTDSTRHKIIEKYEYKYSVAATSWDSTIVSTPINSTNLSSNSREESIGNDIQNEFLFNPSLRVNSNLTLGGHYKLTLFENNPFEDGHYLGVNSNYAKHGWTIYGALSYGVYNFKETKGGLFSSDSTYNSRALVWDSTYTNSYGNIENDSIFYLYQNKFTVYQPTLTTTKVKKEIGQLDLSVGRYFGNLYLATLISLKKELNSDKIDSYLEFGGSYVYNYWSIWGSYSRGDSYMMTTFDKKYINISQEKLNNSYELGLSKYLGAGFNLYLDYFHKEYQNYKQNLYLIGLSYNLK